MHVSGEKCANLGEITSRNLHGERWMRLCDSLICLCIHLPRSRAVAKEIIWLASVHSKYISKLLSSESVTFDLHMKISKNVFTQHTIIHQQRSAPSPYPKNAGSNWLALHGAWCERKNSNSHHTRLPSIRRVCKCVRETCYQNAIETNERRKDPWRTKQNKKICISKNLKSAHKN